MTNEEAEKLLNTIEVLSFRDTTEIYFLEDVDNAIDIAIKALQVMKVGKWIHWTDDYKDYATCSCCAYGEEGEVLMKNRTPYCPICGTKMEGWADDE